MHPDVVEFSKVEVGSRGRASVAISVVFLIKYCGKGLTKQTTRGVKVLVIHQDHASKRPNGVVVVVIGGRLDLKVSYRLGNFAEVFILRTGHVQLCQICSRPGSQMTRGHEASDS
eukprot:TRINITY_DN12086_c0_g1_i12.p4 TRINITY_DN12086_c0_g1~~TRINITY_DN12086_c0_g1_i12.p4  ORF type:complete len:115 (-),score=4.92 TRINITY_DN12086_c0_g1_i12:1350-1694(-)